MKTGNLTVFFPAMWGDLCLDGDTSRSTSVAFLNPPFPTSVPPKRHHHEVESRTQKRCDACGISP